MPQAQARGGIRAPGMDRHKVRWIALIQYQQFRLGEYNIYHTRPDYDRVQHSSTFVHSQYFYRTSKKTEPREQKTRSNKGKVKKRRQKKPYISSSSSSSSAQSPARLCTSPSPLTSSTHPFSFSALLTNPHPPCSYASTIGLEHAEQQS